MNKQELYDKYFERVSASVRSTMSQHVNLSSLGNSKRDTRDLAIDLVNNAISMGSSVNEIAAGCFLCKATVTNLAQGKTTRPAYTTIDSVLRYFELEMKCKAVKYRATYLPGPAKVVKLRAKKAAKRRKAA